MVRPFTDAYALRELADSRQVFDISSKIKEFPRLKEAVERELAALEPADRPSSWADLPVSGKIGFGYVDERSEAIGADLAVSAAVPVVCQRCLELFEFELDTTAALLFAQNGADDDGAEVREGYETWELSGDRVRPVELADEALVMAMPFAAKHTEERCGARFAPEEEKPDTVRPFADLKALMAGADKDRDPAE